AMAYLAERQAEGEIVTGLLYVNPDPGDLHGALGTTDRQLNSLSDAELVPGQAALDRINAGLR
ncbi:MAG: 2-oxoacid:ferredoxin oxidoreductase subunit beta, partial [Alphaproteobacteria bacterium]